MAAAISRDPVLPVMLRILRAPDGGFHLVIGANKEKEKVWFETWRQAKNHGERLRRQGYRWVYPDQHYYV